MILRSRATFLIHTIGWMVFLGFPLLFMNRTQQKMLKIKRRPAIEPMELQLKDG